MNPKILYSLSYGMYAIGVNGKDKPSACIANTVFQITSVPAIIAVSINHDNYTNECIKQTNMFTISVLSEETSGTVIGALGFNSGKKIDKLKNVNYQMLKEGYPIIKENCCCWFLCKVINSVETHTHTVFLSEILNGSDNLDKAPMTYSYYRNVIKGIAPKNAPTYQDPSSNVSDTSSYICTICGYTYNGNNKPFNELSSDWVCPICGAPKSVFKLKD